MKITATRPARIAMVAAFLPAPALADDELGPKTTRWFCCPLDNGKTVAICGSHSTDADAAIFGADDKAWLQCPNITTKTVAPRDPDATGDQLLRPFRRAINFTPSGNPEQITFRFINDGISYLPEGPQLPGHGQRVDRLVVTEVASGMIMAEHLCRSADAYEPQPVVDALPCDPAYSGNVTRSGPYQHNGKVD